MSTPVHERAGSQIDHRVAYRVGKNYGLIDPSKSLYQLGGEQKTMVLWKWRLLGLGVDEWDCVQSACSHIEYIESTNNECWAISVEKARRVGRMYTTNKERFGIPVDAFDITDACGVVVRAASIE